MKSLLVVAHGSKRERSNDEVLELMAQLQEGMRGDYPIIVSAFLEFAHPTIHEAIDLCLQQGATSIKVLPYFLAAGKHVDVDIPQQTHLACADNQQVDVEILPHLGSSEKMVELMRGVIARH